MHCVQQGGSFMAKVAGSAKKSSLASKEKSAKKSADSASGKDRGETLRRQWELIQTLQSHRFGIGVDELSERLSCDTRTIQRYIKMLRKYFSIEEETREFGKKFWKLSKTVFEPKGFDLTLTEMISLYLSQQLLLPLSGTPFGNGLQTAIQKIRTILPKETLSYFEGMNQSLFIKSLATQDYSKHERTIHDLNDSIAAETMVTLTYHSASKKKEVTSGFHPYGVVVWNSSIYCIGFLEVYKEVRTLKVSRIKRLIRSDIPFDKPIDFSLSSQFAGAFGIMRSANKQEVTLQLTDWAATNVREMTWHPSQEITHDDGQTATVTYYLGITAEFKRWLLGFGRHVKILGPATLAADIREELRLSLENH
jgi:predicted DNA-binding transcriptional regulator YafY